MVQPVSREITQRELRNDSGGILRAVEQGSTFVVTRNGSPVAELVPLRRRTFVPAAQVLAMFAHEAPLDADRFFADLDGVVDQGLLGE
ncbi:MULTISPECIES: type II toxin-antitoxin system Phd/YefM family antitoxin [Protofrankia]|uniref:Prevent-host-death family protein n=1 Tax=Candidatus Protofrankia datiscae TaxID=2716812 RepID=F8B1A3_9ACTN|nr:MULTISPECIES: type II toxin-antitoxin system prevent-host-death family antitoxin [Protofrankia]AEH08850.1 prevent-host-death family protein [Candidatus Protofrankia datiscae]